MAATAFVGGTLINGTGRAPIPDAVILVTDERIVSVYRGGEFGVPDDARVVDISGKTVVPGLIDCHVHMGILVDGKVLPMDDPLAATDRYMRQFIEHGITTVRDTGGTYPNMIEKFKQGQSGWPRWYGAGAVLDGDPSRTIATLRPVDNPAAAREVVPQLIDEGGDFLKAYIELKPEVLRAIVEEAHARGVRVTAHVGHRVTVEEAVRMGVDSLEHVRVGPELVPEADRKAFEGIPERFWDAVVSWASWRFVDPSSERAGQLIELMVERGVIITPTLILSQSILLGDEAAVLNPPGLDTLPQSQWLRDEWARTAVPNDYTEEDFRQGRLELSRQMEFIGRARRGGVKITAGTDVIMPFVVPGNGLHEELRLLVESGLTPMEALVAATGQAAELLGQQNLLGTVEKGKLADMVILDADPLQDIQKPREKNLGRSLNRARS